MVGPLLQVKANQDLFRVMLVVVTIIAALAPISEALAAVPEDPLEQEECPAERRQATERNSAGLTRLHFAAYKGDVTMAEKLILNGALVDAQSNTGHTPLHVACQEGHSELVQMLLRSGAALEVRAAAGITPLYLAAQKKQLEAVRLLLSSGAEVSAATETGNTPLHFAAEYGNVEVGRVLIEKGAVDLLTNAGHTPLHLAARQRKGSSSTEAAAKLEMARLLLASRAAVDVQDRTGHTPLHLASHAGAAPIVHMLLEHGANASRPSSRELTAVDMVVYGTPPDPDALVEAASRTTIETLTSFSASTCTPHPWTGQTTLHVMAFLGLDSLVPPGAIRDARFYLQRGDGIQARLSAGFVPEQENRHVEAYERAIQLDPTSAAAYARLGAARAQLAASSEGRSSSYQRQVAEENEASMLEAFRTAWQLQPERFARVEEFAREKAELALVGWHNDDSPKGEVHGNAQASPDLAVHWETPAQRPAALRQALKLWRQHGAVIFVGLLNASIVSGLQQAVHDVLVEAGDMAKTGTVDRSSNIRAPAGRTLRALPVSHGAQALTAISAELFPFLSAALGDPRQLLLEIAAYRAAPGAAMQEWHRDDPVRDLRVASMQIALSDTQSEQGALELQLGTHGISQKEQPREFTAAVGQGSVVLYSPFIVHRGRANTLRTERIAITATLLGANGLVPNGIPLAVQPEDAGKWWMVDGDLKEKPT